MGTALTLGAADDDADDDVEEDATADELTLG